MKEGKKDLSTSVQYIKGIGPRRAEALAEQGITTVRDLLYYFPFGYIDLSKVEKVKSLRRFMNTGEWVTIIGEVRAFDLVGRFPKQRFIVVLGDETGTVQLLFFSGVQYFKTAFEVGETIAVSGRVSEFNNRPQFVHPSIDHLSADTENGQTLKGFLNTKGILPKYGSTQELKGVRLDVKGFRRVMRSVIDEFADDVEEFLPSSILKQHGLPGLQEALRWIHFPDTQAVLDQARRRLKYDELFSMQLLLAIRRKIVKTDLPGIQFSVKSRLVERLVQSLPFTLTKAQQRAITEIENDMKSPRPMQRLLQGDVGSGKTIVALHAMLIAVENGYQAAFMAPTEILAEQHYRTLTTFAENLGVHIRLLIGGQRTKLRRDVLEDIRRGSAQIVVGTHAIIQESVEFARLGLVVIDEQHRFGVAQRLALRQKAGNGEHGEPSPDMLVMTATPIPRTLSLTVYGDLDVSVIDELPAGRQTIRTAIRTESQKEKIYSFLRAEIKKGRQAYIVYPLIEESEKLDLKSATEGYEHLRTEVFPDLHVGLLHGRIPSNEKDSIMNDFKDRKIDILVATTVVEVGIDIPNATVMIIEHAERFGLSQLHQLRGRVGRGADQSYCILMAPEWIGKIVNRRLQQDLGTDEESEMIRAARRLRTVVETTDGFKIAEVDLELRGPGEFFGTRQSGLPVLQLASLLRDEDILILARRDAQQLIEEDPQLRKKAHESLRRYFTARMSDALAMIHGG